MKGQKLRLEKLEEHHHMPEIFTALGKCGSGANGPEPLTFSEIVMFAQGVVELSDWEIETLQAMSSGFCSGLRTGEKTFGVFPGDDPIVDDGDEEDG